VYGWVNAGFDFSTSNKSNIPESYAIVTNKLELDQAVGALSVFRTPYKKITWTGDSALPRCTASIIAGPQRKDGLVDNS
jgi:hypothetical protein